MSFKVELAPAAKRQIEKLDRSQQQRIVRRIERLAGNPRPSGCEPVETLKDFLKVRVGDYRIVYTVKDSESLIVIGKVAHRSEVYKRFDGLKNLLKK